MIPRLQNGTVEATSVYNETYHLDVESGRIAGRIDGVEAIIQAAFKILHTERFAYPIYSQYYGAEIVDIIGQDKAYVNAVLATRLTDALTADDRITGITDLVVTDAGGADMQCSFVLITSAGDARIEWGLT
ncbi:DUF2634 domain-containing protein [Ruminococcaceae bacterium OttesenSCG-928-N02]|nr:DUF2634 domain-containing protein [Ruminococcaceae bacterium OttesenSCG-928-N02]